MQNQNQTLRFPHQPCWCVQNFVCLRTKIILKLKAESFIHGQVSQHSWKHSAEKDNSISTLFPLRNVLFSVFCFSVSYWIHLLWGFVCLFVSFFLFFVIPKILVVNGTKDTLSRSSKVYLFQFLSSGFPTVWPSLRNAIF